MSYSAIYNLIGIKEEVNRLQKQANLGWNKEFRTLKWLGLKDGMKILDVGAGPGFYTELLLNNLPNTEITALEYDKNLMGICKNRLDKYGERIRFEEKSINDSALASNTYDFIIARFVFQHLDEPILAMKEIYRLLKPGGIVVVIDSDKGLCGISEPEFIMSSERNILRKIEKGARWNREIGRKLLKILTISGFEELDFEAVTIHSDIVGLKNIIGDIGLKQEEIMNLANKNPRLAKVLKVSNDLISSQNSTIILLNLIAKGVKVK